MSDLKVTKVGQQATPDQYGNVSYWVEVEGITAGILVKHRPDKPVMKVGETFEQHGFVGYEELQKKDGTGSYFKAKRPAQQQNSSNNGGSRPKDPAERESIERQVAAKCATELLVGFMGTGWKPSTVNDLASQHQGLAKQIAVEIKGV